MMPPKNQEIVGENFKHLEEYVKYKWGLEGFERFKRIQKIDIDSMYSERFYPLDEYVVLLEAMQEMFDDDNLAFNIGWHRARNLVLAKGKRKRGPELLSLVVSAWKKFVNFGNISIENLDDGSVTITISEYSSHPLYCERMKGFFAGLVKENRVCEESVLNTKCVCNGDDRCEYNIKL